MDHIFTSKGLLPLDQLTFSTGIVDDDNEHTTWEEWRDGTGEIVKRNVHIRIKKGVEMTTELGRAG